ncbi:glutathione S-transferase N-terminal domain-containing protein [Pseudooceanicola nitratireducens]|uniref:glutathione S-transferase N-terminal domain-containing protein n=1 Tax=Pseudooceanicola nitratireducens TaxID=517719 RepID=UPI001C95A708|nr:glutathione S-transferase N-terminal domain-containing protein [Pseudooceanicola nitratireducens]MBY6167694.1 glutathione S-transferase N-terminal domain-containing protein [Pseudooceanicola nitratireducens]
MLLDFLEIAHEKQAVDFFPGLEHKSDAFLRINPLGQIPVLEDDGAHIRDAQAILVYLACLQTGNGIFKRDAVFFAPNQAISAKGVPDRCWASRRSVPQPLPLGVYTPS